MSRLIVRAINAATLAILSAVTLTGTAQAYSYWYCWDNGSPQPHHLGHQVAGDHPCTAQEMQQPAQ